MTDSGRPPRVEQEKPAAAAAERRPKLSPKGPPGTGVRIGRAGPQVIRTRGHRWSEEAEEIFLDALSLTCNATFAAAQAGFSVNAVYKRRRSDARFAARWDQARQQGVARLDLLLIRGAEAALEGRTPDSESPLPPMTVADAIAIVRMYGEKPGGEPRRRDWTARPRELDEVKGSILSKLSALERTLAREAAEAAEAGEDAGAGRDGPRGDGEGEGGGSAP